MDIKTEVSDLLGQLVDLPQREIYNLLEIPPEEKLGDVAFPCFVLSKAMKNNPTKISAELQEKIQIPEHSIIAKAVAIGPYLNFYYDTVNLAKSTLHMIFDQKSNYGIKTTKNQSVVVEFCSPNTNKPLHLGHLRNLVIGESMSRLFESQGFNVHRVCLNNNRGIHISKSMLAYQKWGNNKEPDKKSDHYVGDYYVQFSQKSKEDPTLEQEALELLKKWEVDHPDTVALWKKMNQWALDGFEQTYARFGVRFDNYYNESDHYKSGRDTILAGLEKGLFYKNEAGAIAVDLDDNLGTKILLRADGTSVYITQDLYLGELKAKSVPNLVQSIYVVANEQNYHFKVLFKLFELLGFDYYNKVYHLNYGMVYLPEGRMKSREGTVVDADNLMDELQKLAVQEIKARQTVSEAHIESVAEKIGLSALKYYLLKASPKRDVTFNPEDSIAFEGDTGPYILYSLVRAKKILKKSSITVSTNVNVTKIQQDEESRLIKLLYHFTKVLTLATSEYSPNSLVQYLYKLASAFSLFYEKHKVLNAQDTSIVKARLLLVYSFTVIMETGLRLLGIDAVEEM